jgi:serine/threonine-protein kinase
MEYVEGNSLREYFVRGTRFDARDTVSVMVQVLDALQHAHQQGVWHRDIKPANILVMSNGRIKLTDFGMRASSRPTSRNQRGDGRRVSSPRAYPPRVDHRYLFAAGVLFYSLLAGQSPFQGRPEAVMHEVCYHDPPPPSTVDAHRRWPQYDPIVARALEKSPARRYQSALAFRTALLAEYAQPLDSTLSDATIIPTARRRPIGGDSGAPSVPRSTPVAATATATSTPPPTGWSAPVRPGSRSSWRASSPGRARAGRRARDAWDIQHDGGLLRPSAARRPRGLRARGSPAVACVAARARRRAGHLPPAGAAGGAPLSAAELEQATRVLTRYIGPIARVVVAGRRRRRQPAHFLNQVAQAWTAKRSANASCARRPFLGPGMNPSDLLLNAAGGAVVRLCTRCAGSYCLMTLAVCRGSRPGGRVTLICGPK